MAPPKRHLRIFVEQSCERETRPTGLGERFGAEIASEPFGSSSSQELSPACDLAPAVLQTRIGEMIDSTLKMGPRTAAV